jgi:hypothetical protein
MTIATRSPPKPSLLKFQEKKVKQKKIVGSNFILGHATSSTFDEFLRPVEVFNHVLRKFLIGRSALDCKLRTAAADLKVGRNNKNLPKSRIEKIREIDLSYLCQQQFDNFLI